MNNELPSGLQVARKLRRSIGPTIAVRERNGSDSCLASFAQQRLWFLAQMGEAREAYHIFVNLRLNGTLQKEALRRALDGLIARHETLRTTFYLADGGVFQRIGTADTSFGLYEEDLRGLEDARERLSCHIQGESSASFDFERGPLIRGRLIRLANDEHVLLITMHHIISDGWSMGILTRELSALYKAYCFGEPNPLAPLAIQYAEYAAWQRAWLSGKRLEQQSTYWQRMLSGAPGITDLPTDRRRPEQQDFRGGVVPLVLDETLTAGLNALSRRYGMTLFTTVLAAWSLVLSRLSNQEEVVIGTPTANRGRLEIEGLIGFFVNTLPLRVDLSGAPTVKQLIQRVKDVALGAQAHQDLPFEQIVELIKPVRSLKHTPIFQVLFAWHNNEGGVLDLPGLSVSAIAGGRAAARFDLALNLTETGGRVAGGLNYAMSLFDRETIERYAGYLRKVLSGFVADPSQLAGRLPMLSDAEHHQLLVAWNATQKEYSRERCIHELFEEQVRRDPQATAVVCEDQSLSYEELNARANRLARHLSGLGVKPDGRVAMCFERSVEMVVGLLATLKAGGAYVPLDPKYPAERLAFMLQDAAPGIVLTHVAARVNLQAALDACEISTTVVDLQRDAGVWAMLPTTNLRVDATDLTSGNLAYVIYTSGSTAKPKGVMIEHAGVVNYLAWAQHAYRLESGNGAPINTSLAFDATVTSLWGALVSGRSIRLLPEGEGELVALADLLRRRVMLSLVKLTPSQLDVLQQQQNPIGSEDGSAGAFVIGGEELTARQVSFWRPRMPSVRLINEYGPTEATVGTVVYEVGDLSLLDGCVPIGRPIWNTRIYLLDGFGNPVPQGAVGEIYIGGAGVARGYLNREELTAERFIPSPFVQGDRLYKTGDLGRYLADGNIEFLGRNDFQVKIRGFRIELGEIEARLMSHPMVREAVVLAREDEPGDKRLAAYYTVREAGEQPDAQQLRAHLAGSLPEYMVPAAYVRLESLPLTANGKLDRKALPAPEDQAYSRGVYAAPEGAVETALAEIWSEVLGIERVGRHDNFFELGGHSLLAIRVLERMRRAGLRSDVRALFTTPVLADLAGTIDQGGDEIEVPANLIPSGCERITPELLPLVSLTQDQIDGIVGTVSGGSANVQDIYPLAPLQEGILFHHLLQQEGDPYVLWDQLSFADRAGLDRYVAGLNAVIARHDILRTGIVWEGLTEPVQVVWRQAPVVAEEIFFDPKEGGDVAEQLKERFSPRHYRLDVRHAPMMRVFIANDRSQDRWIMMRLRHHLSGDHITTEAMQAEIAAHIVGKSSDLPAPLPFRNFVAQARLGVKQEEHEAFFREMLRDVSEPTAPFGLMDALGDGSGIAEARVMLAADLAQRIRSKARSLGVSAASLCHVAWALVLSRCSGQKDPVFGTVLFGRMQGGEGAERTLGLFINTLPVRISLGELGAQESVLKAHQLLAELIHHEHASLALAQRCSGVPAPAPLFTSLLNYRHSTPRPKEKEQADRPRALQEVRFLRGEERTNYPITLSVEDLGEALGLTVQAVVSVGAERVCAMMERALEQLVEALETEPERPVGRLDVLVPAERHKLLVEWNATEAEYPKDKCIHELFEAQVERDPTATAVVYEDQSLSYGELNERANRLAHHLRSMGVRPDERVAICVERSLEMVVGLLAILKAGGCYVPLDPQYPAERLGFMLRDAAPAVVLTHAAARSRLGEALDASAVRAKVLDIDAVAEWAMCSADNPEASAIGLTSGRLAYIIYTSGSTGQPKGVMIEHGNFINLSSWHCEVFCLRSEDRSSSLAGVSFDASAWELWPPLLSGAVVVLSAAYTTAQELIKWWRMQQLTTSFLPTALVTEAFSQRIQNPYLRVVLIGGEKFERLPPVCWDGILVNNYGPTECSVVATSGLLSSDDMVITIGRPIWNTRIYLLDGFGNPVPQGVVGEIYIGGAGVARGYLNREELTAERFIPSPFVQGDRLYKTGDLGRYLADGNIEFLGRNDFQVKIRGFRIELGEIEARLMSHPMVREAVVLAREDESGDKRLVAYYTARESCEPPDAQQLRIHLAGSLPEYMVPAAYVRLESLPLTANGKLDRKALPAPEDQAYSRGVYAAPEGAVETALAEIWSEVLGIERVGRHDNFFELGGHSLLAIRVLERMRRAGLRSDVRALFTTPVLADLAG